MINLLQNVLARDVVKSENIDETRYEICRADLASLPIV